MKASSKLAPDRNPEGATERAAQVITAMAQEGHISETMAKAALAHPAQAAKGLGAGSANYAADYVMDMLDDTIGAIDQDLVVTTTIDPRLQAAEGALKEELDKKGAKYGVSQGFIVSIDPNGAIRALVGGRDYSESRYNRAVSAKRQPGSAFKPFVYLAGLEHGMTPESVREDGPLNIKGWTPENYSHEYFGPVTLTKALALSLNTVAVRVGLEVGPKAVVKTAHRLGIQSDLQPNASSRSARRKPRRWSLSPPMRPSRTAGSACAAAHHHAGEDGERQDALPAQGLRLRPCYRAAICGHDEHDDAGDAADRHGAQGGLARMAGGRQDGHQPDARRLACRLYEPARHRRVARQ